MITEAQGAWVTDVENRLYLDCLAGYSALNFGHRHPQLIRAAQEQLERVTLTSRAFHNDQLASFATELADLAGMESVLPMNTGAEAVETALKLARRWGATVKGVSEGSGRIIVAAGNFHGRTTTIISFSTDETARRGFGPFTPGFDIVPFGDASALEAAVTDETVAVLLEPIQGEAGVVLPAPGYLGTVRQLCTDRNLLFIADEIQSGLGRTGYTFACEHEGVQPDIFILGKALGGGVVPVSAVLSNKEVMDVNTPGSHGSTFGGNPLAAAVGHAVVKLLKTGVYQQRARNLGDQLREGLSTLIGHGVTAVRCRGLWAGVDIDPTLMTGREASERLAKRGILCKDTHGSTIRIAPPLVITDREIDHLLEATKDVIVSR